MEINLRITKELMELAVPASKEPKGIIFSRMEPKINAVIEDIADDKLGEVGITAVNGASSGRLAMAVISLATVDVFIHELHGMDLVLTPTGFGVVSTNDTVPASKIRIDSLDGELRVKWLHLYDELLEECFKLDGWYQQGLMMIDTLFCLFKYLKTFAGKQAPLAKDWEDASTVILETDRWLRDKISDEYMDELIGLMATNTLTEKARGIVHQIRRIIGMAIQGNKGAMYEYYRRLMNTLESDLETFSTYAESQAYQVNHFKPYENEQESGAFHFVG